MGLFTSKAVTWRRGMQTNVDSRGEFDQLERTIGREKAKVFLETVYDKWINGLKYDIKNLDAKLAAAFMKTERENFASRKHYVDSLVPRTRSGDLGTVMNANLRQATDYYKNPLRNGLGGRDLAIDQAANWVCGSYVAGLASTRSILNHYIPATGGQHGPMGYALGRTAEPLRKMYKKITAGQNIGPYRINLTGGVKYPSTVGGGVLLDYIFSLTSGTNSWPPFGDKHWESIAMFYMISIVHVQGFTDANKRTGHMAYAIVLIKGTHSFKVPTVAKENELFKMNG
jgi:hypothetical protein